MIVISLSDCPPALRGDLSKWLLEITAGVYVGQVSARVRDELWERIEKNIKHGRAAMVFDAANEQKMDFRIHNTSWELVDCDGLRLVRRPSEERIKQTIEVGEKTGLAPGFSKAAKYQMLRRSGASKKDTRTVSDYTVVDIETTGLDAQKDCIIELGALRVRNWEPVDEFHVLIQAAVHIPEEISVLTGLTDEMLQDEGVPVGEALARLADFVGDDVLLIHNAPFDLGFLKAAARQSPGRAPKKPRNRYLHLVQTQLFEGSGLSAGNPRRPFPDWPVRPAQGAAGLPHGPRGVPGAHAN